MFTHSFYLQFLKIRLGRPFGVAMLFAGIDSDGQAHLFHLDPSGTYIKCLAKAIGAGGDGAEQILREQCLNCNEVISTESSKQYKKSFISEHDHGRGAHHCIDNA